MVLRARYRIIRQIGTGGTGCVYLAEDINIGKNWAVKRISFQKDRSIELAGHEVAMMKQLDYWMFPRIVDAWQEDDCYYIVSDYIEGVSLDVILSRMSIPVSQALEWAEGLAGALQYLHESSPPMLYLDLKPENIMVKPDGMLALIDFGIAQRLAEPGLPFGTPGYAAPEQYGRHPHKSILGTETDIFALGMTLYAMLSGSPPVKNLSEQRERITRNKKISKKIRHFILHCIEANPKKRFQNSHELLPVLKQIKEGYHQKKQKSKAVIIGILALSAGIRALGGCLEKYEQRTLTAQMLQDIGSHVEDGEYTKEGIKIICAYLAGNCLDDATQQQFTYEAAKNYFEIQHNYKEAGRYFSQLDTNVYPETVFFLKLCSLQTQFDENVKETEACLEEFYQYNSCEPYSAKKFENELLIATCYEQLGAKTDGTKEKTIRCLERGIQELLAAEEEKKRGMDTADTTKYMMEYGRRLCILCEETGEVEKMRRYGAIALRCLPKEETIIRQDLQERMGQK